MNPGDICDYRDTHGNHVANVEIMSELPATIGGRQFFIYRRTNNGILVLAWDIDLKVTKEHKAS